LKAATPSSVRFSLGKKEKGRRKFIGYGLRKGDDSTTKGQKKGERKTRGFVGNWKRASVGRGEKLKKCRDQDLTNSGKRKESKNRPNMDARGAITAEKENQSTTNVKTPVS